ncbi:uncharacterized protein [Coffea arabica]|uniref:Uncharacterized protein isoform X2 n=1 Tax=Coffea arabica TaxID=13443 RepID=A0ABM4WHF5_COFAR
MEISLVSGNGITPIPNSQSPLTRSCFPFLPFPFSATAVRPFKNSKFTVFATTTVELNETRNWQRNVPPKSSKIVSLRNKTRQSAILDVQESSDLDSALSRSGGKLKAQDLNVILRHFGKLNRWKELSQLLVGCAKAKDGYSKATELVRELKYHGLQMDSVIYGTLLSVCASNNQCQEAERYFMEMKSEGYSPNVFHYSSLINAYSVDGKYTKADELIQEMKSGGLVLNKVILTTLLKVYVRGGLFEKSRELINKLDKLGYAEDEMPYCILMDGLVKAGKVTEAKTLFDEMKNKNVKTDGYAYSIMISGFCRGGLLQDAKQLASSYEAKYDRYDIVILNTMLCAYCRAGEMDNVMKMLKKVDESAISPDWNTFHILIRYFCKEKLYILAYHTLDDMHKKGHQPEEELCSSLIHYLGKTGAHAEAFSVYNILKYSKRTMCNALHEKILHILVAGRLLKDAYIIIKDNAGSISQSATQKFAVSFMKSGNINLVNDVIKAIHSSGYKIDQKLFHMAISRYVEDSEKKDLLLQLLKWMPGQGYSVDSSTRNLILKKSHLYGCQIVAELLSKQQVVSKTKSRRTRTK